MRTLLPLLCSTLAAFAADAPAPLAPTKADVPYAGTTDFRQTLNVYAPATKPSKLAPVVFWIHGGGWQGGEKTSVQLKPKFFTDMGYVFVSTNHRYVKAAPMNEIFADIAKSLHWTHDHVAEFGGDPNRVIIMGHSSGAQLAAYLAIDERPLKAEGLSLSMFKGCVPVDADTFDIPAVIAMASAARQAAGKPEPKYGHREIFGGKPELWADYSATQHVAAGKGIPPFLILYDSASALTPDQAKRLESALTSKGISAKAFGATNTNHGKINNDLGLPNDPSTAEVLAFLKTVLAK
jgi:acetyl esterase/lipase